MGLFRGLKYALPLAILLWIAIFYTIIKGGTRIIDCFTNLI